MNDEQKYVVARELCRLRGIDPDMIVAHGADPSPDGVVHDVVLYSPAWVRALREIEAKEALDVAVAHGKIE